MVSTFDPAAHLSKQGWKGKGTALKQGHATRPLAVVQKKTLSGIGKDRDEAVPFWDQIFAATAASIFSSPSGSGASSPIPQRAAHSTTRDWITTSYSAPVSGNSTPTQMTVKPKNGGAPSTQARIGKEMARKGLYSRFLRGKTVVVEPEPEEEAAAGPSTLVGVVEEIPKGKGKREGETKEERRARRAEKARRKTEKAAALATATEPEKYDQTAGLKKENPERKKKKRKSASEEAELEVKSEEAKAEELTKRKKEKKRKAQAESHAQSGKETAEVVQEGRDQKAERKKKRRKAEA